MVDYRNSQDRLDVLSNINKNFKPIGLAIKKAREEQNISLVFLSKALKISEDYLMAIEKGDKSSLPEPVYVKAMLRKIFERLNIETLDSEDLLNNKEEGSSSKKGTKESSNKGFYIMTILLSLLAIILGAYSARFVLKYNLELSNNQENVSAL